MKLRRLMMRGLLLCAMWGVSCTLSHNPDLPSFGDGDGDGDGIGDGDINVGDGDGNGDGTGGASYPAGGAPLGGSGLVGDVNTTEDLGGGGSTP